MQRRKLCYAGLVALIALTAPALAEDAQDAQDARQAFVGNLAADVQALKNDLRHLDNSAGILAGHDGQELADLRAQIKWWKDCASGAIPGCWEWVKPSAPQ